MKLCLLTNLSFKVSANNFINPQIGSQFISNNIYNNKLISS